MWSRYDDLMEKVQLQGVEADVGDYIKWADNYVVGGLYADPFNGSQKIIWFH